MIRFQFITIALLLFATTVNAQIASIEGKWVFKDINNPEKIDTTSLKMLRKMFGDASFYFKPNGHYKIFMRKNEEGSWTYNSEFKKLILTANKGTESQMEVISITDTLLVLSIAENKSFVLRKAVANKDDDTEEPVNTFETVKATTAQLSRKWFLVKREVPDRTPEQQKTVMALVAGSYFNFKQDGSYESEILNIKNVGKWQFEKDNKWLVLTSDNYKTIWGIKSITDTGLELIKGNTTEVWTFSTMQ